MTPFDGLKWLGIGVSIFGVGFTVWAFYVRSARQSLEAMREAMNVLVSTKIDHLEKQIAGLQKEIHGTRALSIQILERVARMEGKGTNHD